MPLPLSLIEAFAQIQASDLVSGTITNTEVQKFVKLLNSAIPSKDRVALYSIYRFNRNKYFADKKRFLLDIKSFHPYEAMILWTDYDDILSFFNLTRKIFLGWDKVKMRYRGHVLSQRNENAKESSMDTQHAPSPEETSMDTQHAPSPEETSMDTQHAPSPEETSMDTQHAPSPEESSMDTQHAHSSEETSMDAPQPIEQIKEETFHQSMDDMDRVFEYMRQKQIRIVSI